MSDDSAIGLAIITGGLGFIGQALANYLQAINVPVVVIDKRAVSAQVHGLHVVHGAVEDEQVWQTLDLAPQGTVVFHCAGLISVAESVVDPSKYYETNVCASLAMLNHILQFIGPVPVVFSSSAAVYGVPQHVPIPETSPLVPLSPYGETKRQFEEILAAYQQAYGLPWVALRYFNAAGTMGTVVERHEPESHLLPRVRNAVVAGKDPIVYGTDYPTLDGTAVRDYVHVHDLADAHVRAAQYLLQGGASRALNLGSGQGTSVGQVISAFEGVVGRAIPVHYAERRAGDPPELVADISQARLTLGWAPRYSSIQRIVSEVWGQLTERT